MGLELDAQVRLVVFGYDDDQAKGANFNKHINRLRGALDTQEATENGCF